MDHQSLVAAHLPAHRRSPPMSAAAEDRYYNNQITLPPVNIALLGSIVTTAGVILILGISLI